jgi:hypothetical protein
MNRKDILELAGELTAEIRDEVYGDPLTNHERIAEIWSAILDVNVKREEVVLCMIAVKMSRLCQSLDHTDSWVDIAGYAAIGGEMTDD